MSARFFLVSELGAAGLWLLDTETKTVTHYSEGDLKADAKLPDGESLASVIGLGHHHKYTVTKGVGLAVAVESKSIAAAFNKVE